MKNHQLVQAPQIRRPIIDKEPEKAVPTPSQLFKLALSTDWPDTKTVFLFPFDWMWPKLKAPQDFSPSELATKEGSIMVLANSKVIQILLNLRINSKFPGEDQENAINGFTRQSSSSEADSDVEMRTLKLTGGDDEFDDENEGLQMHIQDVTLSALADESNEAICGEYSNYYDTFQLIGNGTFGSVKLSARKDTGLLVS